MVLVLVCFHWVEWIKDVSQGAELREESCVKWVIMMLRSKGSEEIEL